MLESALDKQQCLDLR